MLRLTALGGLSIEGVGGVVRGAARQHRPLALLAFLSARERPCERDEVLLMLWPDSTPCRAKHLLSQNLYALRRDLQASDLLIPAQGSVCLNPEVITSDVREFRRALARGDLESALKVYRGDFLGGFHLDDSPEFEAWRKAERTRLLSLFGGVVETLATDAERVGDNQGALMLWRRWVAADPLNPTAVCGMMGALALCGDSSGALRRAEGHRLLSTYEGGPSQAVMAAAAAIRASGFLLAAAGQAPAFARLWHG